MSGPDLHVFTLKFHSNFSPKKTGFFTFSDSKKNFFKNFLSNYCATFHCGRYSVFKKILNFFLPLKTWKNHPKKLLIICPDPFFSELPIGSNPSQISIQLFHKNLPPREFSLMTVAGCADCICLLLQFLLLLSLFTTNY